MFKNAAQRLEAIRTANHKLWELLSLISGDIGQDTLKDTLTDLRIHLDDPYLFVIVGEVKAGKSSFINALLRSEKEICRVAPSPMTDTIQQIVYGEVESEIFLNTHLKKITLPIDILKDIAIVDTPGTNTIIDHHQEITERFIPAADLIIFVFEAKNPYRESAWQFFDYINAQWWKKVVFVLQQKDLLPSEDLAINIDGVHAQAKKKGVRDARVFAVSAKQELQSELDSGYEALRNYIQSEILDGKAPVLKQQNNLSTLRTIYNRMKEGVDTRKQQFELDSRFRNDIKESLDRQQQFSARQVDMLVENLVSAYDGVTRPRIGEIEDGLGFFNMIGRSFSSTFGSGMKPTEWLNDILGKMEQDLSYKLKQKLNDGVVDIADSIQQMAKVVDLKIRNSQTVLKDDHHIFSDIAEKRAYILQDLHQSFSSFMSNSTNFYDPSITKGTEHIPSTLATGSGMAVVGIVLSTITNGMVFDITGGVLTTLGLLFAGVTIGFQKRKILRQFNAEIDKGRTRFHSEISHSLKEYIASIKDKIDANFHKFDQHLDTEKRDLDRFENNLTTSVQQINEIEKAIHRELI